MIAKPSFSAEACPAYRGKKAWEKFHNRIQRRIMKGLGIWGHEYDQAACLRFIRFLKSPFPTKPVDEKRTHHQGKKR